ncbi:MAG: TRAP transporter small permease subunit [Acetobacterales bacterium]
MTGFERGLDALVLRIVRVCELIAIFVGGWLTVTLVLGVFFRYVVNSSIGWLSEVSPLMLVVLMLAVAPIGFHENIHISVEVLVAKVSRPLRVALGLFANAGTLVLFGVAGWYGAKVVGFDMGRELDSLPIVRAWFTVAMPVAAVAVWLVCINNMLKILRLGDLPPRIGGLE